VTASLDLEAAATLFAGLGEVHARLTERQQFIADLEGAIDSPETRAISFLGSSAAGGIGGALAPHQWGPAMGFTWFVQLVTVGPLNSGDTLALYRGRSIFDNEPQRLKQQWIGTNGTWQAWAPGRTALKLAGGKDGVVFDPGSGSLTGGTRYFVNIDVIQVADRALAMFLV
jgi:hypothetical protein